MPIPLPPREELLSALDYEPITGVLRWKVFAGGKKPGERAGGRLQLSYKGVKYKISRVIWKMIHDEEPPEVDHKNCNEADNALKNLRAATRAQNVHNRRIFRNNTSGAMGVKRRGNKFRAALTINGKRVYLGKFDTVEEAAACRAKAVQKYHGEFGRTE